MQHKDCIEAIQTYQAVSAKQSNVHTNPDECQCPHKASVCKWVGNNVHYACLQDETNAPQRVYSKMNGTKMSSLTPPTL